MSTVFLNGRFIDQDAATLSAFDAGVQHGVGLFETMLARADEEGDPDVIGLVEHLERLIGSATALGLSNSLQRDALADAVVATVRRSKLTEDGGRARVRLTVTGGDLNLLGRHGGTKARSHEEGKSGGTQEGHDPTILIHAQPATAYPREMFERGVAVTIADMKLNPLDPMAGHKTLNYWGRLRELQLAAAKRAAEAIVLQVTNHLGGGCVSNVFIVKGGRLLTPIARGEEGAGAIPSPVLPGISRAMVMAHAREQKMEIEQRMLTIDDLLGADEVFLTNSSWGVLPVVKVEREAIGDGVVGGVTKEMFAAYPRA